MNPSRYFIPQVGRNPMMYSNSLYHNFDIFNLFNRLGNGIKNFNWRGLFNGVNKTLNVVNKTIPLVKEAKPMYDNVKSMFLLTKAFKKETRSNNNNNNNIVNKFSYSKKDITNKINTSDINKPIFFI